MRIGIVGIGFMGVTHFHAIQSLDVARVGAICTRDQRKLTGDWRDIKGNFGDGGGVVDLEGIATYSTALDLVNDPNLDLIDICVPTDLHRHVAEAALQAGKHVLVEKPIAATVADADAMIEAAEKYGRNLFVGHVVRFFPQFRLIWDYQRSGELGALRALHLKRVISKPLDRERIAYRGGVVLDLHIHDANFVQMLFGMPKEVYATGIMYEEFPVHVSVNYRYDDVNVSVVTGYLGVPSISFEQGYAAYFADGTLQYSSAVGKEPVLWRGDREEPVRPRISPQDPFAAQLQYVVEACRGKHDGALLSAAEARDSLVLVEKVTESLRTGRPVPVD